MTRLLTLSLLLTGCAGNDADALLARFADAAEALRGTVDDHAAMMEAASNLDSVPGLEDGYATDWAEAMIDMRQAVDDLGGCTMDVDAMGWMDDADGACDEMDGAVSEHVSAQEQCYTLTTCQANEADHVEAMHGWLDRLDADHDGMMGTGMTCHMGDMGMGSDSSD